MIVNFDVSVTSPRKPSNLLKTGALVSLGGTTLSAGTTQLITAASDLTNVLNPSLAIEALAYNSGTVTLTTNASLSDMDASLTAGDTVQITVKGATPSAYNGTFTATIASDTTLTYPLSADPGTAAILGTASLAAAAELTAMVDSFFAQGTSRAVYILELGIVTATAGVAALASFIAEDIALGFVNQTFFAYLVPRAFAAESTFKTLCNQYTSNVSMVYFFTTMTSDQYAAWSALAYKSVFGFIESPDADTDSTFDCAAPFQSMLSNNPGSNTRVPPMAFRFTYGTTVYPLKGNAATLKAFLAANVNYIGKAAEGGLSNMMLCNGHLLDGNPVNFWYSVAWTILNLDQAIANEVINGSNTSVNPLYYDQDGIDRLQKRALNTLRSGIGYGLILGTSVGTKLTQDDFTANLNDGDYEGEAVVNAIPFSDYTAANTSDYADGVYNGLTGVITPKRGFESITFALNVTNLVG